MGSLVCCCRTVHLADAYNADYLEGFCFRGQHTTDPGSVRYNGINIKECECDEDEAEEALHELADQSIECEVECGYGQLPNGKCVCEYCFCDYIRKGECCCGALGRALEACGKGLPCVAKSKLNLAIGS